jgi:hypothetical protein
MRCGSRGGNTGGRWRIEFDGFEDEADFGGERLS